MHGVPGRPTRVPAHEATSAALAGAALPDVDQLIPIETRRHAARAQAPPDAPRHAFRSTSRSAPAEPGGELLRMRDHIRSHGVNV